MNLKADVGPAVQHAATYMHMGEWSRGHAWVNGHHLGRFWTQAGPQQALYVPGHWLQQRHNEVVVLEICQRQNGHGAKPRSVWLRDKPDLSGPAREQE